MSETRIEAALGLSKEVESALGRMVMTGAGLEYYTKLSICLFLGAGNKKGMLVAGSMPFSQMIETAKELVS